MGFIPCLDQQDPFTRKVRETYRANVVRAPQTGIDPLDTLAVRKRAVEPRGRLTAMIDGLAPDLPVPETAEVASLRGERSTTLDIGLGADLTSTFLAALGVSLPSTEVTATLWHNADRLTFEVRDVAQQQVDVAELGRALAGRRVVRNPATDVFFADTKTRLLIITRTLTTASFAVHATNSSGQSANVSVDGLKDVLGTANANVSWTTDGESTVIFRGPNPATFALAAVPCAISGNGTFVFGLESADATMGDQPGVADPPMRPVVNEPGLLSFDTDD